MSEEKEAIDYLKNDVVYWLDKGKDFVVIDIGENEKLHSILNLIEKQQKEIEEKSTIIMAGAEKVKQLEKEIEDNKKFKKDIVSKIMFWDKEGLPKDEVIIRVLDTLMDEVSRLEDIEDKKIEVAIDFIEEKRDKYWKDKIRELLKSKDIELTGVISYRELEELLKEN